MRKIRKTMTQEIFNTIKRMYFNEELPMSVIARSTDMCYVTVQNTIQKILNGIDFIPASVKHKQSFSAKSSIITRDELVIQRSISANNSINLQEMKDKIISEGNPKISISTICRKVKKLGYKRKRLVVLPIERNIDRILDDRVMYGNEISRYPVESLVFLDETGFNKHTRRAYGYAPAGSNAYIEVTGNRGVNTSVLAVISISGVIDFEIRTGAYNSDLFFSFLETKIIPYFALNRNKILIMDNVRFHHSNRVKTLLNHNGILFKFLPAYSPQLNPIEEFFSMLKAKYNETDVNLPIRDRIIIAFNNNFREECEGFYRNMLRWLVIARARGEFR